MIALPDPKINWGYNENNYIVVFNRQNDDHHDWSSLNVMMHEVGHSLDLSAYPDSPLSLSETWKTAYNQDSDVPDQYAASTPLEDVAQSTVVATYDLVVPGGLGNMKHDWHSIQHQYELIKKEQGGAGNLLLPGGQCTARLENSEMVHVPSKKIRRVPRGVTVMKGKPKVDLAEGLEVIPPTEFSTENNCHF